MVDRLNPVRGAVVVLGGLALLAAGCTADSAATATATSAASITATASSTPAAASPTATGTAASSPTSTPPATGAAANVSYRDATYQIDGRSVTLKAGVLEVEAAPGSASKITTKVFGNEATGDLNGDGVRDTAFLLTQSPGGSGTFFYIAVALARADGTSTGTNAVLLGDRVSPQSTVVRDGVIEVAYAERKPGEPMTASPSVGVSKRLRITDGKLVEIR